MPAKETRMITLTDIFEVSAALEDGSLDVHLRAQLGFRAWHMVVEHETALGTVALIHVIQAGDKADNQYRPWISHRRRRYRAALLRVSRGPRRSVVSDGASKLSVQLSR